MFRRTCVLEVALFLSVSSPAFGADTPKVDRSGDSLPPGAVARLGTLRWRSSASILFAAYLNDKRLLTVNQDQLVQVWDESTGCVLRAFSAKLDSAPSRGLEMPSSRLIALSGDGRRLAFGSYSTGAVYVWDVSNGKQVAHFGSTAAPQSQIALSHDGKSLAVIGGDRRLTVYDHIGESDSTSRVCNGSRLLNQYIYRLEFSPDDQHLFMLALNLVNPVQPTATDWDLKADPIAFRSIPLPDGLDSNLIARAVVSRDHTMLAGVSPTRLSVVQLKTGEIYHETDIEGFDYRSNLAFTPDGKKLVVVSSSSDRVKIWDVASKKFILSSGATGAGATRASPTVSRPNALSFAPDGKTLLIPQESAIALLDLESGRIRNDVAAHFGPIRGASFSHDGKSVLTRGSDFTVRGWDRSTGHPGARLSVLGDAGPWAVSADGRWLVAGKAGEPFRVIDVEKQRENYKFAAEAGGRSDTIAISPDSTTVAAVARFSQVITIRDLATGRNEIELRLPDSDQPDDVRIRRGIRIVSSRAAPRRLWFSRDSRLLVACDGSSIVVWEWRDRRLFGRIRIGEGVYPIDVAISPDNSSVTMETAFGEITIWEIATGSRVATLSAPTVDARQINQFGRTSFDSIDPPTVLDYSPDCRMIASTRRDGTVVIWDVWSRSEVASIKCYESQPTCVAFSPDGQFLLTASNDGTALLWDVAPFRSKLNPLRAKFDVTQLEKAWTSLLSTQAETAAAAIVSLASDPDMSLPFLKKHLAPAEAPNAKELTRWIVDLNDPKYNVRETARRRLAAAGEAALPALQEAMRQSLSAEVRSQARSLVELLTNTPISGEELRMLRVVEILELIGTPDAKTALKLLADGAENTNLTRRAKSALHRLEIVARWHFGPG
jgi:WD40 repeat protein